MFSIGSEVAIACGEVKRGTVRLFFEQDPTFPPTFSRPVNLNILKQGDFAF
jgi:hypothetical protein